VARAPHWLLLADLFRRPALSPSLVTVSNHDDHRVAIVLADRRSPSMADSSSSSPASEHLVEGHREARESEVFVGWCGSQGFVTGKPFPQTLRRVVRGAQGR
jgi:hypothetical protein